MLYLKQYEPNKKRIAALNFDNPNEGDQKVFCSPPSDFLNTYET